MKYFTYIARNARRNPVRSLLTITSVGISLFLMMILVSFFSMNNELAAKRRGFHRLITMNAQGFAGMVPIARAREVAALDGVVAACPFLWYMGKYQDEFIPFAQFGVDAKTVFTVRDELMISRAELEAFQADPAGCVLGRKLADTRGLKVGDPLPLKGDLYPFSLNLTVRGIYDVPPNSDRDACFFHWEYLDEGLKRDYQGQMSGNAGMIFIKCKSEDAMTRVARQIDSLYVNSDNPTRTQAEDAWIVMFADMMGDLRDVIQGIGLAVVVSLLCVAGNSMAMALRERTTEIAVLKAIGFSKPLVLCLVLAEAMMVAGLGGIAGAIGCKLLCDVVDMAQFTGGFLPFFYVSWSTALLGLGVSLFIGFWSGFVPAVRAAQGSVINGLRKVV
jgi:putative ABC transport system permease protein